MESAHRPARRLRAHHSMRHAADLMNLHPGVIYGPIRSRRLGLSLGVNVLPPLRKVCSFNCIYCQYGWTEPRRPSMLEPADWPDVHAVFEATAEALASLAARGVTVDRLTLAGHGEPTLHPRFPAIVDALRALRDARAPGVPVAVLSNSTTAHQPRIAHALARADECYMKLDAGDRDTLRHVNASAASIDDMVEALAALPRVVVQSMFVAAPRGRDNTSPAAIGNWVAALARIRPEAVHLYTLARQPAWDALGPVPESTLRRIAARAREVGVTALVFP